MQNQPNTAAARLQRNARNVVTWATQNGQEQTSAKVMVHAYFSQKGMITGMNPNYLIRLAQEVETVLQQHARACG